jgi:RND family efflux transporter MFP subunit
MNNPRDAYSDRRSVGTWTIRVAVAGLLVTAGLGLGAMLWRTPAPAPGAGADATVHDPAAHDAPAHDPAAHDDPAAHAASSAPATEVVVRLTPEMMARAGIRTAAVTSGTVETTLRLPGVVQPNAYRQVTVTSLVAGRLTEVRGELGQRVKGGQVLASVYSPEFADLQTDYAALHAEEAAHDLQLIRTQRLASIGAASLEEYQMMEAAHARLEAAVEASGSRLRLLGFSEQRLDALAKDHKVTPSAEVTAPIDGVIVERGANTGLNIDPATPLFTVVDLATVWVIGDVYERDLASVGVGRRATVTSAAYPGLTLDGRISYVDPSINPETRTAKVRVEVKNPAGQLKLGMFVNLSVEGASPSTTALVPRTAVQTIADRTVVYVTSPATPGEFVERHVEVAEGSGEQVAVLKGLAAGEMIVTEGAFFLRAERERTAPAAHPH